MVHSEWNWILESKWYKSQKNTQYNSIYIELKSRQNSTIFCFWIKNIFISGKAINEVKEMINTSFSGYSWWWRKRASKILVVCSLNWVVGTLVLVLLFCYAIHLSLYHTYIIHVVLHEWMINLLDISTNVVNF